MLNRRIGGRVRHSFIPVLQLSIGLCASAAQADPPKFSVLKVNGVDAPAAINNHGDIGGSRTVGGASSPEDRAVIWLYGSHHLIEFGTLGGKQSSISGLNDCDEAVGASSLKGDAVTHAALFQNGKVRDLDVRDTGNSIARGINNAGVAVGSITVKGVSHPALFQNGKVHDLTGSRGDAYGISLSGQITGESVNQNDEDHAFIIDSGMLTDINPGYGAVSDAAAINDYGHVAGTEAAEFAFDVGPFLEDDSGFEGLPVLGPQVAMGFGLNNADEVVGTTTYDDNPFIYHAFLYRNGVTYDLNTLIDPADPLAGSVNLTEARGINDSGWIVAAGTDAKGVAHTYLLVRTSPDIELRRSKGGCGPDDHDDDR